jgi:O-antigen ligase
MKLDDFIYTSNKFINICYYLIIFFPLSLIAGPAVAEIFMFLLIILTFTIQDFRKNFFEIIKNSLIIKLFTVFSLYILFLSIIHYENLDVFKTGLFYFRYILFSIAIFYLISKNQRILSDLFIFYLILISIILIDSFIQYYFGQNILGYEKFGSRVVSFFEGEGILGSFIVRFYTLAVAFYFLSKVLVNKVVLFLVIFLVIILLIYTLERSAMILFLISNILLFFLIFKNTKFFLLKFFIISFITILSFTLIAHKNKFFGDRFVLQTKNEILKFFDDSFEYKRKNILNVSYNMGSKYYLIGLGPKSFRYKCQDLKYQVEGTKKFDEKTRLELNCINHPHNYIFQLYAETGIVGLIFYLFFLIFLLKKIFFSINNDTLSLCKKIIAVSLLVSVFPVIGNGNFFNNFLNMIFFYNLGFFLFFDRHKINK